MRTGRWLPSLAIAALNLALSHSPTHAVVAATLLAGLLRLADWHHNDAKLHGDW